MMPDPAGLGQHPAPETAECCPNQPADPGVAARLEQIRLNLDGGFYYRHGDFGLDELEVAESTVRWLLAQVEAHVRDLAFAREQLVGAREGQHAAIQRAEGLRLQLESVTWERDQLAARLRIVVDEQQEMRAELDIFHNPARWMKWCDVQVLERCETLEAQLAALQGRLTRIQQLPDKWRSGIHEEWKENPCDRCYDQALKSCVEDLAACLRDPGVE